jgi:hypothetical protein
VHLTKWWFQCAFNIIFFLSFFSFTLQIYNVFLHNQWQSLLHHWWNLLPILTMPITNSKEMLKASLEKVGWQYECILVLLWRAIWNKASSSCICILCYHILFDNIITLFLSHFLLKEYLMRLQLDDLLVLLLFQLCWLRFWCHIPLFKVLHWEVFNLTYFIFFSFPS